MNEAKRTSRFTYFLGVSAVAIVTQFALLTPAVAKDVHYDTPDDIFADAESIYNAAIREPCKNWIVDGAILALEKRMREIAALNARLRGALAELADAPDDPLMNAWIAKRRGQKPSWEDHERELAKWIRKLEGKGVCLDLPPPVPQTPGTQPPVGAGGPPKGGDKLGPPPEPPQKVEITPPPGPPSPPADGCDVVSYHDYIKALREQIAAAEHNLAKYKSILEELKSDLANFEAELAQLYIIQQSEPVRDARVYTPETWQRIETLERYVAIDKESQPELERLIVEYQKALDEDIVKLNSAGQPYCPPPSTGMVPGEAGDSEVERTPTYEPGGSTDPGGSQTGEAEREPEAPPVPASGKPHAPFTGSLTKGRLISRIVHKVDKPGKPVSPAPQVEMPAPAPKTQNPRNNLHTYQWPRSRHWDHEPDEPAAEAPSMMPRIEAHSHVRFVSPGARFERPLIGIRENNGIASQATSVHIGGGFSETGPVLSVRPQTGESGWGGGAVALHAAPHFDARPESGGAHSLSFH